MQVNTSHETEQQPPAPPAPKPPVQVNDVHETKQQLPPAPTCTENEPVHVSKSHQIDAATSEPVVTSSGALVLETTEPERVLQEAEARLREKIRNAKPACADGENIHVEAISNAHGKCTGFFGEDSILPEFLKYGNKLYVLHCKDGAVAYVCGVCRVGYTTLQGFEQHAKEAHGWSFS